MQVQKIAIFSCVKVNISEQTLSNPAEKRSYNNVSITSKQRRVILRHVSVGKKNPSPGIFNYWYGKATLLTF